MTNLEGNNAVNAAGELEALPQVHPDVDGVIKYEVSRCQQYLLDDAAAGQSNNAEPDSAADAYDSVLQYRDYLMRIWHQSAAGDYDGVTAFLLHRKETAFQELRRLRRDPTIDEEERIDVETYLAAQKDLARWHKALQTSGIPLNGSYQVLDKSYEMLDMQIRGAMEADILAMESTEYYEMLLQAVESRRALAAIARLRQQNASH